MPKTKKSIALLLVAMFVFTIFPINGFAADTTLDLSRNKVVVGDSVTAKGVSDPGKWISVKIVDTDGNIIYYDAVKSDENGNYSNKFKVPDVEEGDLIVVAGYGKNVDTNTLTVVRKRSSGGGSKTPEEPTEPEKPINPEQPTDPEKPDVPATQVGNDIPANHWAKNSINKLVKKGIIKGDAGSGNVRPNDKVSREEITAMLVRAMDVPVKNDGQINSGDNSSPWAKDVLKAAEEAGIIKGDGSGNMSGQRNSNRLEVAVMIARAKGLESDNISVLDSFADSANIPEWAKTSVAGLIESNVIEGYGDKTLRLNNQITRAEAFAMLDRILD